MIKILVSILLLVQSFHSFSQSSWKIENEYGDEILLTIDLNREKNTFEAYSRKDALKDLAGVFTFTLAKAAGKLKYAEIIFIEGKTQKIGDSLLLSGNFNYFDKQYSFNASISGIRFRGQYVDNRNRIHQLAGVKMADNKPIKDYSAIVGAALSLTEKNLARKEWLKTDEWLNFKKKANELKGKIADDYELAAIFFWLGKKLPFAPYEISRITTRRRPNDRKDVTRIRELKTNTALLDANSLPLTAAEMDSVALIISKKNYSNLIIDLRGNSRITPSTANYLLNYLVDKPFSAGIYLTRRWFETNLKIPDSQNYTKSFKTFTEPGYKAGDLYKETGRYLRVVPSGKTFKGKIYVLSNQKTSRVGEVLAYLLKKEIHAKVAGQKSSGMSWLNESMVINREYELNLPVSEFYDADGKTPDRSVMEPDWNVGSEDALTYVLKLL